MPWVDGLPSFRWPVRVYYEDTDAGGIVYYANFLKYFERCRTEWLRAIGIDQTALVQRDGLQFVVQELACEYLRPARLDDELAVLAQVERLGGASILFAQQIRHAEHVLAAGRVKVACVDTRRMAPAPLPKPLVQALKPPVRGNNHRE